MAAGDVVAVDDGVGFAVGAVHDALADGCRKAGEEGCFGGLDVHFSTFGVEAVFANGNVLLQGVVDACLQIPLCRKGLCTVLLLCAGGCFLSLQRHAADAGACHAE